MAGGGVVIVGGGRKYDGGITFFVVITCIVAAMGGLIFGYDLGISGWKYNYETKQNRFSSFFLFFFFFPQLLKFYENIECNIFIYIFMYIYCLQEGLLQWKIS